MRTGTICHIRLDGRSVVYRRVPSASARKLRVRVGPSGIEVVLPRGRTDAESRAFLLAHRRWLLAQMARIKDLRGVRRPSLPPRDGFLYRGILTPVRVEAQATSGGANRVTLGDGNLLIRRGRRSRTPLLRSLENWLRKQARTEVEGELRTVLPKLKRTPHTLYVMGQRTKWGNCSALGNLSFNWRLIMAPPYVLRYVVTHEAVHLAVPDHSRRFWLTVRSLCPEEERARQWLSAHRQMLLSHRNLRG